MAKDMGSASRQIITKISRYVSTEMESSMVDALFTNPRTFTISSVKTRKLIKIAGQVTRQCMRNFEIKLSTSAERYIAADVCKCAI